MTLSNRILVLLQLCSLIALLQPMGGFAQQASGSTTKASTPRDGQHDFDWEVGSWKPCKASAASLGWLQ